MISEAQARELALQRARESTDGQTNDVEFTARLIEPPEIVDLLQQHRVVEVTIHILPPRPIFVTISADGDARLMSDEFNAMMQDEDLMIAQQKQALEIAGLYLQLSRQGQVLILQRSADIPFEGGYWTDPRQFDDVIRPPQSEETDKGFQCDFYAWSEVGGLLERWDCLVTYRGEVIIRGTTRIADLVGDAVIVQ